MAWLAPALRRTLSDLAAALALRAALRGSLRCGRASQPGAGGPGQVNDVLASFPLRLDMRPDGMLRLAASHRARESA